MPNCHIDLSLKAQAFTLVEFAHFSVKKASDITGIARSTISGFCLRAREMGFDRIGNARLQDAFFEAASRSGRLPIATEDVKQELLAQIKKTREINLTNLAEVLPVGRTRIARLLKEAGLRKCKPTMKPGLTSTMRQRQLEFCLEYQDKGLEFWKNCIFSDETSVVLGHRCGGYRLWRTTDERYDVDIVRP